jgi:hypothetical protein
MNDPKMLAQPTPHAEASRFLDLLLDVAVPALAALFTTAIFLLALR